MSQPTSPFREKKDHHSSLSALPNSFDSNEHAPFEALQQCLFILCNNKKMMDLCAKCAS